MIVALVSLVGSLLLAAAYLIAGARFARRQIPQFWVEERKNRYNSEEYRQQRVKAKYWCTALCWVIYLPSRTLNHRIDALLACYDPNEQDRRIAERDRRIRELERELGIK